MAIKRILVPVDFSSGSGRQLTLAVEMAEKFAASIEVLHVLEAPMYAPPEGMVTVSGGATRSLQEFARQEAERDMKELLVPLWSEGKVRVTHRIEPGMPSAAATILDVASQGGIDLIVMSTRGRSGLEQILLGSVTEKVVRKASCAVLVTR